MMCDTLNNIRITIEDGLHSDSRLIQLGEGEAERLFFDNRIAPVSFKDRKPPFIQIKYIVRISLKIYNQMFELIQHSLIFY